MSRLLKDQVAVITGGNSGLGRAIAQRFATQGAHLYLLGRNSTRGQEVVGELQQLIEGDQRTRFCEVDVSQSTAVEEVIKSILEQEGRIDILVNNAGITRDALLIRMTEEQWDDVLNTNLKAAYSTCRVVVRAMMKARRGKIINISSVVGLTGNPGQSHYAASKSGLIGFSKSLARELASRNITVNCIAPGFFETPMTAVLTDAQKETILSGIPMNRMGRAEEIGDAAVFLASDWASYITGQVLTVDGGMVM
jgi:3-oxoacyl-[acyl-carrier protein] reductase